MRSCYNPENFKPYYPPTRMEKIPVAFETVRIPASMGDSVEYPPTQGQYVNKIVKYEADSTVWLYDSLGNYTQVSYGDTGGVISVNGKKGKVILTTSDLENDSDYVTGTYVTEAVGVEAHDRELADQGLQSQIDAITVSSDVKDVVGTHADLENYDTSTLGNNDIIKVLQDETQDDETTYYRWSTSTETFTLIGAEGPYYTKSAADAKFQDKLTAGDHITINSSNEISADGQTIFYANSQETGATRHIYKDATFTQAASAQDLLDANEEGPVVLRITTNPNPDGLFSDAYIQNTYVGNNDYQFLFLDERTYREYAASAPSDTTFYYFSNTIQSELTPGTNIQINNNTISATDTTYSNFTGTDGVDPGTAGLVPAPATTDAGKYLKADGTWDTVSAGPTVVQTTGTSQTDVMSQVATSQLIYPSGYETSKTRIVIPAALTAQDGGISIGATKYGVNSVLIGRAAGGSLSLGSGCTAVGSAASTHGNYSVAVGLGSSANNASSVAIGRLASSTHDFSIALGYNSTTSRNYEVSVGSSVNNITSYIANVKDPQLAQDAATKNYTDNLTISYAAINNAGAPTTATEAKYIGQLYCDTTNSDLYYCSAITPQGTDPETYTYTWTVVGGGPTVVQTTGTSTTDVMSQNATTSMVFQDPSTKKIVRIGSTSTTSYDVGIAIGNGASSSSRGVAIGSSSTQSGGFDAVAIGSRVVANGTSAIAIGGASTEAWKTYAMNTGSIAIGRGAESRADDGVALGQSAKVLSGHSYSIAFADSTTGRTNEVSFGNPTGAVPTRYLANVTDPQLPQDAATKNYVDTKAIGTDETYTIADTDWTALSASSPYTYSADVTATYTIGANTIVELLNDQAVNFATYGFAIGAVSSQTVTIYSIGAPSSSVTLKVNYKG